MAGAKRGIASKLAEVGARAERERNKVVKYVRVGRPPKSDAERGQVYSIRIPAERIEKLRVIAEANGKQPAVQARDWILEHLDEGSVRTKQKPRRSSVPSSSRKASEGKASKHPTKAAAKRR